MSAAPAVWFWKDGVYGSGGMLSDSPSLRWCVMQAPRAAVRPSRKREKQQEERILKGYPRKNLDKKRDDEKLLVSEMIALYCRKQHKTPKGQSSLACQEPQTTHRSALTNARLEAKTLFGLQSALLSLPSAGADPRGDVLAARMLPSGTVPSVKHTGGDPQGKTGSAKNGCIIARQTGHPVCREVINMENIGVTCDVCACCHNVAGCKCDLPQIKVTEQCTCNTQQEGTPHYCQNYEEK